MTLIVSPACPVLGFSASVEDHFTVIEMLGGRNHGNS